MMVSVIDLNTAKMNAPFGDLYCTALFCLTLLFLIALSEALRAAGNFG